MFDTSLWTGLLCGARGVWCSRGVPAAAAAVCVVFLAWVRARGSFSWEVCACGVVCGVLEREGGCCVLLFCCFVVLLFSLRVYVRGVVWLVCM